MAKKKPKLRKTAPAKSKDKQEFSTKSGGVVRFRGSRRPATAKQVAAFEAVLSVKLPADYKKFLYTTNGGIPTPNCFNVPDRSDALCDILYGIHEKRGQSDLEWEQEQASQWDPLPLGFVAIGHDPGGSSLLLATSGKDAGKVYFWNRDGMWVREDGHNTFPVANSFTAFLAGLREMPERSGSSPVPTKPTKRRRGKRRA